MFRTLWDNLRWSGWLGAKFMWAVPGSTVTVVLATLVAQLSLLLAFFLPLKVIILLGSDGIPRYFPPSFAEFDRDALILWLSAATVGFYILYLVADRIGIAASDRGARRLLERSRKMVLFERQDEIATAGYHRYAKALAGAVFVVLSGGLFFWLYPAVAVLFLGFILSATAGLLAGMAVSVRFQEHLTDNLAGWINVLSAIGFMLVFVWLVADFLYGDPPGLIPAIIALLLTRQAFQRGGAAVQQVRGIVSDRARLDALFFHRRVWLPENKETRKSIWPLLEPETRAQWVPEVLASLLDRPVPEAVDIRWWQTATGDIPTLYCTLDDNEGYFVKIFARNRTGQARHEATLLSDPPPGLPAPEWIGATEVRGFQCHVLRLSGADAGRRKDLHRVREQLLAVRPAARVVERYARSRAFLWQRLETGMLERLRVAADESEWQIPDELAARMDDWREALRRLPLAYVNPELRPENMVRSPDGEPLLVHWGRWVLEPAGARWKTTRGDLKALQAAAESAQEFRAELASVSGECLVLAALSAGLESQCQVHQYQGALDLACRIHASLEATDSSNPEGVA
ncbi:hypothetical protein [Thioalkalivibrio sp. ALE11]|uniref:hypothetical protein n=1 Tax=Thioalkalivibrio sp. ALE11 TaxID=1265494 RepID=UPI00047782AE